MNTEDLTAQDAELAMTSALGNYLKLQYQLKGIESGKDFMLDRFMPSKSKTQSDLLMRLEIMKKRRELGLPDSTSEYQDLLNEPKTMLDPGRAITLGSVALSSKQPLLKLGASPFLKGIEHGAAGRAIGAIGRIFK